MTIQLMEQKTNSFAVEELERISEKYKVPVRVAFVTESSADLLADILLISSEFYQQQFNERIELERDGFAIQKREGKTYIIGNTNRALLYGSYAYCEKQYGYQGSRLKERFPVKDAYNWEKGYFKQPLFERRSIVIEEIDDLSFLKNLIAWSGRNGINELFFTFQLWDKVREVITPELEKRGIDVCLGGHSLEFLLGEEKEDLNESVFGEEDYLDRVIARINHYLDKTEIITRVSLWPKDKGVAKEKSSTFINDYIRFTERIAENVRIKVEFIAYNAGLSWAMLERKNDYPEGLDLLFAYWGRDYSVSLRNSDDHQKKANRFLEDWLAHEKNNQTTVFEYYSDFFMQTELLPPLAKRIVDDVRYYKEKGVSGLSNLIVPVKKSILTSNPDNEDFWKQSCQFNNYAFASAMWGNSEEYIYQTFFEEEGEVLSLYRNTLQALEQKLSVVSSFNTSEFPLRVVDDIQLAEQSDFLKQLLEVRDIILESSALERKEEYMNEYLSSLLSKVNDYVLLLKESKR